VRWAGVLDYRFIEIVALRAHTNLQHSKSNTHAKRNTRKEKSCKLDFLTLHHVLPSSLTKTNFLFEAWWFWTSFSNNNTVITKSWIPVIPSDTTLEDKHVIEWNSKLTAPFVG
jgi:hypothetical protein